MIADCSNGMEPTFALVFEKRVTVGRFFYEFILWTAVAFSFFLPEEEFKFRLYNRFLLDQGLGTLVGAVFGIFILFAIFAVYFVLYIYTK